MPSQDSTVDFPAPPPSPAVAGRHSFLANDDVLTEFLQNSLVVPDLVLPDRVFPRQVHIESPPIIDFRSLTSLENDSVMKVVCDSVSNTGCFQITNYGIGREERRAALAAGGGVFGLGREEKKKVRRELEEREYGFEGYDEGVEGEKDASEEFVWGRDERLRLEMEGVWPLGYSNFSEKMEAVFLEVEKLAHSILLAFEKHGIVRPRYENVTKPNGSLMCYIYKQCPNLDGKDWVNSIKYDVLKMLIRGSDYYSHALGLHVCDGCSEFHVYSKKGWVSFVPDENALVVTVGDQIQAWSDGECKNVIGRPIRRGGDGEFISLAFLYSPNANKQTSIEKTISLGQQALIAILFTFVYHFFIYICKK